MGDMEAERLHHRLALFEVKHIEFANREMANIVLSIDGRKEINDRMRPFRGGQGIS